MGQPLLKSTGAEMNRREFLNHAATGTTLLSCAMLNIGNTLSDGLSVKTILQSRGAAGGLLAAVKQVCERLAKHGWRDLMLSHGLDILAPDLRAELSKPLDK